MGVEPGRGLSPRLMRTPIRAAAIAHSAPASSAKPSHGTHSGKEGEPTRQQPPISTLWVKSNRDLHLPLSLAAELELAIEGCLNLGIKLAIRSTADREYSGHSEGGQLIDLDMNTGGDIQHVEPAR